MAESITKEDLLSIQIHQLELEKSKILIENATNFYNLQELKLRYFILQLYRKYNIQDNYLISQDDGTIKEKEEK